jgi:hypothetical protein
MELLNGCPAWNSWTLWRLPGIDAIGRELAVPGELRDLDVAAMLDQRDGARNGKSLASR